MFFNVWCRTNVSGETSCLRQPIFKYICIVTKTRVAHLHYVHKKTEHECTVFIIRRKHCRAVHKDFKDFLSSARLWSPKRGSAAVEQPCSRALPFVSFVPNSLSCHPGFHPCHPGFIWTACLATQAPIFASLPPIQSSLLLQTPRRSCIHFQICLILPELSHGFDAEIPYSISYVTAQICLRRLYVPLFRSSLLFIELCFAA